MIVPFCLDSDSFVAFGDRVETIHGWQSASRNSEMLSAAYPIEQFLPSKPLHQKEHLTTIELFTELLKLRCGASEKAFSECSHFFAQYLKAHNFILKPLDMVGDSEGGLTFAWKDNNRYCEILFPETEAPYLYYSSGSTYGAQEPLTVNVLAVRLEWLVGSGD